MDDADLGGNQHLFSLGVFGQFHHAPGRQHMRALFGQVTVGSHPQDGCGAAALGVDHHLGVRMRSHLVSDILRRDACVHMALAHPDVDVLAARLAFHMRAEELVREEQDLGVFGDAAHDIGSVGRGAADVALGLHRSRGIDVGNDDRAGVFGLPRTEFFWRDGVCQRAAGSQVGEQYPLLRAQDLCRLGHEMHTAEDDLWSIGLRRDARQIQRVAHVVADVLDLRNHVVVGQDHGVALLGQRFHLRSPPGELLVGQRAARPSDPQWDASWFGSDRGCGGVASHLYNLDGGATTTATLAVQASDFRRSSRRRR